MSEIAQDICVPEKKVGGWGAPTPTAAMIADMEVGEEVFFPGHTPGTIQKETFVARLRARRLNSRASFHSECEEIDGVKGVWLCRLA